MRANEQKIKAQCIQEFAITNFRVLTIFFRKRDFSPNKKTQIFARARKRQRDRDREAKRETETRRSSSGETLATALRRELGEKKTKRERCSILLLRRW